MTQQNSHPAQPLLDRIKAIEAAGMPYAEAVALAQAGKVRVKAKTEPQKELP